MQEHSHELLDDATPDELLSCIQLLAISVVQHRAKCGFVTLRKSTKDFRDTAASAGTAGLFVQSKAVLDEALEIVRMLAAETASAPARPARSSTRRKPDTVSHQNFPTNQGIMAT